MLEFFQKYFLNKIRNSRERLLEEMSYRAVQSILQEMQEGNEKFDGFNESDYTQGSFKFSSRLLKKS